MSEDLRPVQANAQVLRNLGAGFILLIMFSANVTHVIDTRLLSPLMSHFDRLMKLVIHYRTFLSVSINGGANM